MNRRFLTTASLAACAALSFASASEYYASLEAGGVVYADARVLSVNASSLSIRHTRGIAQVALADLEPELQRRYGYDPSRDRERSAQLAALEQWQTEQSRIRLSRQAEAALLRRDAPPGTPESLGSAFASFGEKPQLHRSVDLREVYQSLGISVRRQGGPSCSVHAIVGALEYQLARQLGFPVNVSEDFLIRSTSKSLGRPLRVPDGSTADSFGYMQDEGFALEHVFQAIRGFGLEMEPEEDPERHEVLKRLLQDARFSPFLIPGGRSEVGMANIVHTLNARMPLVAGMRWPHRSTLRYTHTLSKQAPEEGAAHAVALVGYVCETGRVEDLRFIFRNSWGPRWGAGGYGFVAYEYLLQHMTSCYVVELR